MIVVFNDSQKHIQKRTFFFSEWKHSGESNDTQKTQDSQNN